LARAKTRATLTVTLFERLPRADQAEVEAEAVLLLDFAAGDVEKRDVVWA
jgi:hypothetical protein